jgi:hypothetical protein
MSFNYSDPTALNATIPDQAQKPRGWWSRNWKWFIPTLFLCMILLCSGCVVGIFFMIIGGLRQTEPYLPAMQQIQASKEVQEAFGQPIRDDSWMPTFSPDGNNIDERWDLVGPKGKGKAHVKARMGKNKLEIVLIEVTLPNDKRLLLHDEGPGGNDAPAFTPKGADDGEKKQEVAPPPDMNITLPDEGEPKK